MFLRVRVIRPYTGKYQYYTPMYHKFEIYTTSVTGFKKWCDSNHITLISSRIASNNLYNDTFKYFKFYLKSGDWAVEKIIDRWGYFDLEYDMLPLCGRIKFKLFNKFGAFEKFRA